MKTTLHIPRGLSIAPGGAQDPFCLGDLVVYKHSEFPRSGIVTDVTFFDQYTVGYRVFWVDGFVDLCGAEELALMSR